MLPGARLWPKLPKALLAARPAAEPTELVNVWPAEEGLELVVLGEDGKKRSKRAAAL